MQRISGRFRRLPVAGQVRAYHCDMLGQQGSDPPPGGVCPRVTVKQRHGRPRPAPPDPQRLRPDRDSSESETFEEGVVVVAP